jgi:hypothetical protein
MFCNLLHFQPVLFAVFGVFRFVSVPWGTLSPRGTCWTQDLVSQGVWVRVHSSASRLNKRTYSVILDAISRIFLDICEHVLPYLSRVENGEVTYLSKKASRAR